MVELLVTSEGGNQTSLVVRKRIADADGFAREVRWLLRAQGPGVARLHTVDAEVGRYSTVFAGPRTLAAITTGPAGSVDLVEAVWRVLERLHRRGLFHGAVNADHVVVGRDGPVLVSPAGRPHVDRRCDITGFGAMIVGLAEFWSFDASAGDAEIARWTATGLGIQALGRNAPPGAPLTSGAEVRRVLRDLRRPRRSRPWPVSRRRAQDAAAV